MKSFKIFMRRCMTFALLGAFFLLSFPKHIEAVTLEQAQPVMPDIDVFVHQNEHDLSKLAMDAITATLDGKELMVQDFTPSDQGIYYVIMIDISQSISDANIDAITAAVEKLYEQLGKDDQLAVMTFGEEVTVLLQGGEDGETVRTALASIEANDRYTCFYDALKELVEISSAKKNVRRVAIVVSDGRNSKETDMTQAQLEDHLQQSGVAVYALATDNTGDALDEFTSFIEITGGKLLPFVPADAQEKFDELMVSTDRIWHLRLQADSNIADGQLHDLEIRFGELSTLTTQIRPTSWQKDTSNPYLLNHTIDHTAKTVTLDFSEPLGNGNDPAHYKLTASDGTAHPVEITASLGTTITLTCQALTDASGWTLLLDGLTDASMEENPLLPCTLELTPPVTILPDTEVVAEDVQDMLMLLLSVAAVLFLFVLLMVLILVRKYREKHPAKPKKNAPAKGVSRAKNITFEFTDGEKKKKK